MADASTLTLPGATDEATVRRVVAPINAAPAPSTRLSPMMCGVVRGSVRAAWRYGRDQIHRR